MLGKNIIITDNMDWSTREIVEASTDRWQVEKRFRDSNNHELVGMRPIRHWTDNKIRLNLTKPHVAGGIGCGSYLHDAMTSWRVVQHLIAPFSSKK